MSRNRPYTDFPRNEQGLVDNFIGTAYDTVKKVYDNLPEIQRLDGVLEQIPNLAQTTVDNALAAAMPPIREELGEYVDAAKVQAELAEESAEAAAKSALEASKVNLMFPFTFTPSQPIYDVTVITGQPEVNTSGLALWVEGAIEFDFTVLSATTFMLNDVNAYPENAQMRIIVNARFNDQLNSYQKLMEALEKEYLAAASINGRWCGLLATPPTTRLDGSPLQEADEYQNRIDKLRYSWSGIAWVALNSSAQGLEAALALPTGSQKMGFERSFPLKPATSIGYILSLQPINIWETMFTSLVTDKPDINDVSTWDWAPAIQAANDLIRTRFNTYGPGIQNVIDFPGGRYRVKRQLVISPFVKLRSQGMVIFNTEVANDSAFHFKATVGDYSDNVNVVRKQQWFRGPFINGESGGFVWHNSLDPATCTAIEIGTRETISALTPFSRYSACHFAVEGYAVGLKFNRFRNYIGTFDCIHLEGNTENVVFGDSNGANVTDSGENLHFLNSVFAQCQTSFRWYCDGFDINLVNCSYDYIGTIFWFSRLYKKISVIGGHMEAIGGVRAHDGIGGIVLEDSVNTADNGTYAYVGISDVSAFITAGRMVRASSKTHVKLDIDFRKMGLANTPNDVFFATPGAVIRQQNLIIQQRSTYSSWSMNVLRNPLFANEVTGAVMYPTGPAGWVPVVSSAPAEISNQNSSLGGKSIKITGKATGTYYALNCADKHPCRAGDFIQTGLFVRFSENASVADTDVNATIFFYDINDVIILQTSESLNSLGNSQLTLGIFCAHQYSRQAAAPPGTAYYKVRLGVSGNAMNNNETYITGLFATVLK